MSVAEEEIVLSCFFFFFPLFFFPRVGTAYRQYLTACGQTCLNHRCGESEVRITQGELRSPGLHATLQIGCFVRSHAALNAVRLKCKCRVTVCTGNDTGISKTNHSSLTEKKFTGISFTKSCSTMFLCFIFSRRGLGTRGWPFLKRTVLRNVYNS